MAKKFEKFPKPFRKNFKNVLKRPKTFLTISKKFQKRKKFKNISRNFQKRLKKM